jgi:arabinan endo-1,5-alpha-L-arabinosidase
MVLRFASAPTQNTNGNAYSNAIMMGHVRKILWTDDGWPVVLPERYANVPQTIITDSDLVGTWEHITLNYVAGYNKPPQR